MKHTGIKVGNRLPCGRLVPALAAVTLVSNAAFAVNDGEVIAWFPLDEDFLSSVNTSGNNISETDDYIHVPAGGSTNFVSYATPHPILDASGNVERESKYVTLDKSRVYIPLRGFGFEGMTSVTFEAFVRGDNSDVAAWDELMWVSQLNKWNDYQNQSSPATLDKDNMMFYLQNYDGTDGKARVWTRRNTGDDSKILFDGFWHHVALTLEEDGNGGSTAKIYEDYALVKTVTVGTYWRGINSMYFLVLGSKGGNSKIDFDEIRITKGVLQPTQFLCFGESSAPQDGDALLYMPFDGDMTSIAGRFYDEFAVRTGTPVYNSAVWKDYVCEFGNKDALVRTGKNAFSLKADKTVVTKTICNPHMATNAFDSATIEFFIKGPADAADVAKWMEDFHLGKGWREGIGTKFGFLIQADDDRKCYVRVDTEDGSTAATSPFAMTDGKWHHIAVTIEPGNNANTIIKTYFDYGDPVVNTKSGAWVGLQYGKALSFGESSSILWFDEFRITKGVLPKAKFLMARSEAATVISLR